MKELKQVKARLVFSEPVFGLDHLDVTDTFNMTERKYLDRDIDIQVEDQYGERYRIKKQYIAMIKEVRVVAQEVEEVKNAAKPGAKYPETIQ